MSAGVGGGEGDWGSGGGVVGGVVGEMGEPGGGEAWGLSTGGGEAWGSSTGFGGRFRVGKADWLCGGGDGERETGLFGRVESGVDGGGT